MTKVEKAIVFATRAHAGACRKGKTRPYILHPLEAMVIASGITGKEDVLAAAVLHDTVEDTGTSIEEIESLFGERVAALVNAESEDKMKDLPSESTWKARKEATICHLADLDREAKIICLADKLSNLREMSRDYAELGDELWQRFNQKDKAMHGWYYSEIYKILKEEFGAIPEIREYRGLLKSVFGDCETLV